VVQYVGLKPSGGEIVLPVKSAKGAAESMTILAADADGLTVRSQGAESRVTWKTLGEEGIYQLAQPLMAKAPVFVEAAWLKAGIKLGHAGDAAFKEVLDKLREKDGEAAKVIESVMPPAPPKAEKAVDEGQSETQPPAGEATAEEAADDEKKMDFWLGRVVGPDGQINRAAYAAEAKKGDLAAINRMLGPDYAFYHGVAAGEGVPTCPEAPVKSTGKIGRNGAGFRYNLGNPSGDAGGYWTTEGQVLYVPTDRSDAGIDRVDFASFAHGCLVMLPEAAWWGGAHPDPVVNQAALRKAAAGPLGQPFAIERAYWSLSEQGYVLFKSGLLAAVTVNNVYDYPYFMFPKTKVPTALSLTSKSEFVLVTIWDTQTQRGQLAVLAGAATTT